MSKHRHLWDLKIAVEHEKFHTLDQEEYLIVLGNGAPKDKKHETYNCFDYRAYLYDYQSKGFERLN